MKLIEYARYYAALPGVYAGQVLSNVRGIYNVADMIWFRPVRGGAIASTHPFCTGAQPQSERPIWVDNLVFATPRREVDEQLPITLRAESDDVIVTRLGRFMAAMVSKASASENYPEGRPNRMPPAVNYLHGPVHYNGGWFLFNDFTEAIEHLSCRRFRQELHRFVTIEKREPLFVFRDRGYDPKAYAHYVCFMRSVLPWFSNSNGPRRRVLWGNPAPYAVVNIITGHWIDDTRRLLNPRESDLVARPPIPRGLYFQERYRGWRSEVLWPERLLAKLTDQRIRLRGAKENLYFVDARKLRERRREKPQAANGKLAA